MANTPEVPNLRRRFSGLESRVFVLEKLPRQGASGSGIETRHQLVEDTFSFTATGTIHDQTYYMPAPESSSVSHAFILVNLRATCVLLTRPSTTERLVNIYCGPMDSPESDWFIELPQYTTQFCDTLTVTGSWQYTVPISADAIIPDPAGNPSIPVGVGCLLSYISASDPDVDLAGSISVVYF